MNRCTIVLPAHNEENVIEETVMALISAFERISMSILIIDDGSTDGTWDEICRLAGSNPFVSGVRLSRNFGKESAIFAGLEYAKGDCVIVMDADMQHPPEAAAEMYDLWRSKDYSIIEGVKIKRQNENGLNKAGAGFFYGLLRKTSGMDLRNASDFKLLDRSVVDIMKKMTERGTFFRAMSGWLGLPSGKVYYNVGKRHGGRSKWSAFSLIRYGVDSISSYSSAPMQLVTLAGALFFIFAVGMGIQTMYMKLSGRAVEGFTTVIVLLLLIGSILMISLGIIGIYVSRIYNEVKHRPRYIVVDTAGDPTRGR